MWTTISELEPSGRLTLLATRVSSPSETVTVREPRLTLNGPATLPPARLSTTVSPSTDTEIVWPGRPCTT